MDPLIKPGFPRWTHHLVSPVVIGRGGLVALHGAALGLLLHLAALAREKRHAHDLRGRDRLRATCAYADALLDALARRGEPLASHTTMLLRLLDQYSARRSLNVRPYRLQAPMKVSPDGRSA